ncbi:MAG: hypothetical protein AB7F59_10955 [Bdellovibrionales bacterium]
MKQGLFLCILFSMISIPAMSARYFKCMDVEDTEFGVLIKDLDEPIGGQRYTASTFPFSFCQVSADPQYCYVRTEPSVLLNVVCNQGRESLQIFNDYTGQKSRRGPPRRVPSDLACVKLTAASFTAERAKLSHCRSAGY